MENPKLTVRVDDVEMEVELLLLSSSRTLADECAIQKRLGYERYRDWSQNGEGWSAPDAQEALIHVSLARAGIDSVADVSAEAIVEAIVDTLRSVVEDDDLDPTNGG